MSDAHDCFICHASEDKADIAKPLADGLVERGYSVWFDEFELSIGDSLPEEIERGLATSRFGVVILSEKFFEKDWTQHELNGLTMKEILGDDRVILPVWHGIDEKYLRDAAPTLAGRYAARSSDGLESVLDQVSAALDRRRETVGSTSAAVAAAAIPEELPPAEPTELFNSGGVRLGLTGPELMGEEANGPDPQGPGWLTVVVGPAALKHDLVDPTEINANDLRTLDIPGLADRSEANPLMTYDLDPDVGGFTAQIPHEGTPSYLVEIREDGLMQFGWALAVGVGEAPSSSSRAGMVPAYAVGLYIHDMTLAFLKVLESVGYTGEAVANAAVSQVQGMYLAAPRDSYFPSLRGIRDDQVKSRELRGLVPELPNEVGRWTKKFCDRLCLAGGIHTGTYFMDEDGKFTRP